MTYHFPAPWRFPPEQVPYSIVRHIVRGSGIFTLDGATHEVAAGDVILIPEGTILECRATSAELSFTSVRFATTLTIDGHDLFAEAFAVPMVSRPSEELGLREHFEAIVGTWREPTPARSFIATGHLHLIVGGLLAAAHAGSVPADPSIARARRSTPRAQDPRIERVMHHIERTGRATADLDELCRLSHMSPSTLRRAFKAYTGKTLNEFLRDEQMAAAARMLLLTDESVGGIAEEMGFPDANYFTRVFRQVFGISPVAYRREARQG